MKEYKNNEKLINYLISKAQQSCGFLGKIDINAVKCYNNKELV